MYRYGIELANELDIMPMDANSPPQTVTARCEVRSHSRQDSEPETQSSEMSLLLYCTYVTYNIIMCSLNKLSVLGIR